MPVPHHAMPPAAALVLAAVASAAASPLKPHIVFFLADDYGFADVSAVASAGQR